MRDNVQMFHKSKPWFPITDDEWSNESLYLTSSGQLLACRSRQASIVLERYFRFEVSLLSFYARERDGPIWVSGGSDIIT